MTIRDVRNLFANFTTMLPETGFYQVKDVLTNAHFRRNEDGAVLLGGEVWGTLYDFLNLTVEQVEVDNNFYPHTCTIWVRQ